LAFLTKPVPKELLNEAMGALKEFVDREVRTLLLVEDDEVQRRAVMDLVGGEDVQITEVGTGKDALAAVQGRHFDCMVLDLGLPDMSGLDLLNEMKKQSGARSRPRARRHRQPGRASQGPAPPPPPRPTRVRRPIGSTLSSPIALPDAALTTRSPARAAGRA